MVKNPPANAGDVREEGSIPGSGRSSRGRHGTPVFLPGEFHAQRSLAGYSPWSLNSRAGFSEETTTKVALRRFLARGKHS